MASTGEKHFEVQMEHQLSDKNQSVWEWCCCFKAERFCVFGVAAA